MSCKSQDNEVAPEIAIKTYMQDNYYSLICDR